MTEENVTGEWVLCIIFQSRVPCLHLLSRNPCALYAVLRRRYQHRDKRTVGTVGCKQAAGLRLAAMAAVPMCPAICLDGLDGLLECACVQGQTEHCGGSRGRCDGECGLTCGACPWACARHAPAAHALSPSRSIALCCWGHGVVVGVARRVLVLRWLGQWASWASWPCWSWRRRCS